jgi:hypothetical protein
MVIHKKEDRYTIFFSSKKHALDLSPSFFLPPLSFCAYKDRSSIGVAQLISNVG